eukprot:2694141-Prymnesium_polylepis.1
MSKSVASVQPEDTMEHAYNLMQRIQRKGVPVTDADGALMGTLKFRDVVKAAQTGKAQQLVKAWMRRQARGASLHAPAALGLAPLLPRGWPPHRRAICLLCLR